MRKQSRHVESGKNRGSEWDARLRSSVGCDWAPSAIRRVSDVLGLVSRKVDHARRALVQRDHGPGLDAPPEVESGLGLRGEVSSPGTTLVRGNIDYSVATISSLGRIN